MTAPVEPASNAGLRSERFVTAGYRNVFHRAFLYGLGLSKDDMRRPFVGLALAHNEAAPGQAWVRALGDGLKRSASSAGLTEREFIVPESTGNEHDDVVARELVADSAELVVRGHWYDGLVGVAASLQAAAGLAEAIARLRIPGVVVVPNERRAADASLDAFVRVLEHLGIGAGIDLDDRAGLDARLRQVRAEIDGEAAILSAVDRLRTGVPLGALRADVLAAVAAIAHECGVSDARELASEAGDVVQATLSLGNDEVGILVGSGAIGPVEVQELHGDLVIRRPDGSDHLVVTASALPQAESSFVVVVADASRLDVLRVAARTVAHGALTVGAGGTDGTIHVAELAGVRHPGAVDSALNYDRL